MLLGVGESHSQQRRSITNHRRQRHGHSKRNLHQSRIINRDVRPVAHAKRHKPMHQHHKVLRRFLDSPAAYHFHHRHNSRHEHAAEYHQQQQHRPHHRAHRAHQLPIPAPSARSSTNGKNTASPSAAPSSEA